MSWFHSLPDRPGRVSHVLRVVEELRPGARRGRVVRAVCGAWRFELAADGEPSVELTETAAHAECGACARAVAKRSA